MTDTEQVKLRDFIYLDVERLKSLLSQLDRGLLTELADTSGASQTVEGRAGVSIPALLDIGGSGQSVTTDQSTETRTLHDFVFRQTEELLLERHRLKRLPQDFSSARLLTQEVRADLSPVEYVLVQGQLSFSDYKYMSTLLANMNDILRITTRFSYTDRLNNATGGARSAIEKQMNEEIAAGKLDDRYVKDLQKLFGLFLKDRLVIKVIPFPEDPNVRIVGPLREELLREPMEDIRFKFGSSPATAWTVFGQIAAVPQEHETRAELDLAFSNDLDRALQVIFDSLRGIEDQFRITYPEIAIMPITIYRD